MSLLNAHNLRRKLQKLISPISRKEDDARRERILLVILAFISSLSIIFTGSVISLTLQLQTARQGISVMFASLVTLLFCSCIVLVKIGHWKKAGIIFIATLVIPTFYSLAHWGTLLPIPLLTLGLIILITGILFNIRSAIFVSGIIGLYLGLITHAHERALLTVDNSWLSAPLYPNYAIEITVILIVITGLTTLAFSEIETSIKRARRSEALLSKEIQKLDERIIERSQALLAIEQERTKELARFAEIGKISAGILHDMINPVTTLSLVTNYLKQTITPNSPAHDSISQLTSSTQRLEKIITLIKLEIGQDTAKQNIPMAQAVNQAIEAIRYAANQANVSIVTDLSEQAYTICTPAPIHRALVNIGINAIEALSKCKRDQKILQFSLRKSGNQFQLEIKDNGPGMDRRQLRQVFTPFYSTKPQGHGLGLLTARDIFIRELQAQFTVKSRLGKGTTFFISW